MHILIPVLHRPSKPTGVCRHAANLAQSLAENIRVSRVTLLIGRWQRSYFADLLSISSSKIKIVDIDIENTSRSRNLWFFFGLPKVAKKIQPDIIHTSFQFPFIRSCFQVPVVATILDLYPYECPENFGYPQVWFNRAFLQQCVRSSDGLICVSRITLDALTNFFPRVSQRQSTSVIYNVVDFSSIEPKEPDTLVDDTTPFLMTVAQHRKNKNLDMLIRAYAALKDDDKLPSNTHLVIVGSSGPETDKLVTLVQTLDLEQQVQFLSGIADGELRWLYEHASALVIPSSTEGFCIPLAEALALSCPAVCSDIPIFREVGTSNCQYFQLGQQACYNLAEAIMSVLSKKTGQELSADTRFSRSAISHQLVDFYKQL